MKRFSPVLSVLLLLFLTINSISPVYACGPSFIVPVFSFESRPDETFDRFARGQIGIIEPSYNRTFLFAAYRQFNDSAFTSEQQKNLVSIWKNEIYREDDNENATNEAVKNWLAARKKSLAGETEPKIYTDRNYNGGFYFFPNCTAGAFETAAKTLENRIAEHSAADENVRNWTLAQDAVFVNCSSGNKIPEEVSNPAWLKNDRDYQIAAANFYATNFDEAKTRFETIAANRNSPWQPTANYLVARTLIRQASTLEDADYNYERLREKRRPFYEQAEARLQNILSDASQKDFHPATVKLINLVKFRLRPDERIHELASQLSDKQLGENFRQDLIDYSWLLDNLAQNADATAEKREAEKAKQENREINYDVQPELRDFPEKAREDELTDWIFTFQSQDEAAYKHSLSKWRETKNPAWFVAAISKAKKNSSEAAQLLSESGRVDKNSAEFPTVAFHRIRLLMEKGLRGEARAGLDAILKDKSLDLPVSARNRFLNQRMLLAETLNDFLVFAQRRAAAFAWDVLPDQAVNFSEDENKDSQITVWQNRTMFDEDAARVFNDQMPLEVLKQAAASRELPDYLRRNLLVAAWTRATILSNHAVALELAPQLIKVAPEFQPFMNQYVTAKTALERESAATYALLKLPALRPFVESGYGRIINVTEIDSYRDNWWCAPEDFRSNNQSEKAAETHAPTFLTKEQLAAAQFEREQLKKLGNGSTYLARRAMEFSQKAPSDARLAESLHLAVRATRYGCQDCETGKWSRQAHDALKKRFPRSEWTKKTPYWFKDASCETQK